MGLIRKIKRKIKKISIKIRNRKIDSKLKSLEDLNLNKISKITGLKIPKEYKSLSNKKIDDVVLSVKVLKPNCIFFVLKSYEIDDKNIDKIKENALFVVSKKKIEGCNCIICDNPGYYGKKYFNYIRNLVNPKVISVTGSIGKTSTKDMIASVLNEKYGNKLLKSQGNSNSYLKVIEYIKKLDKNIKVYLQESGAGSGYDLVRTTAEMIEPNIAIYTNIKDSHIEWFGSRENIAKEKFSLSDYGKKDGIAVVNYDDDILINHKFKQRTISYSLSNSEADVYAKNIDITSDGTNFTIVDNIRGKKFKIELEVIGEQHVLNSLVAYIVGKELKVKNDLIKKGLKAYKTSGPRQNLIDVGRYKVLADCYNSSYDALSFILRTFDIMKVKENGRKLAVIGDIFELGKLSKKIHTDVGTLLTKYELDKVFFYGDMSKYSYESYKKIKNNCVYSESRDELLKNIRNYMKDNDIILFKASHGMFFAEIIDTLFGTEIGEKSFIAHKEYELLEEKKFSFNIYENHVSLRKYLDDGDNVNIPAVVNNLKVEMLGKAAFINSNIKKIVLPKYLVRIRDICFKNSTLKKIKFNSELKSIGESAFRFCNNIEEVVLPDGLLFIEYRAFADCENLKKVYIPKTVKNMACQVFHNSKNVVICCYKGSFAERYANKRNIKCEYVDE